VPGHAEGEDSPDLLVNASIFAGLLAFFAALVAVFAVVAKPVQNTSFATADDDVAERLYFGSFTEIALIYPDRVEFYVDEANSFAVLSEDLPGNQVVMDYLRQIAASQLSDADQWRELLFAVKPGSTSNMFWLETMSGDAGIGSVSLLWFNADCAHIDDRGSGGREMMEECLLVRR